MRNFFQSGGSSRPKNGKTDSALVSSYGAAGDDTVWNPPAFVPPIQQPGIGVKSSAPTVGSQISSANRYAVEVSVNNNKDGAPAPKPTGNTLTIGPDIYFKGEVKDCDALVVEGNIEAATESRLLRISETGVFVGEAKIETAEISGRFEGKLKATSHLLILPLAKCRATFNSARFALRSAVRSPATCRSRPRPDKSRLRARHPRTPAPACGG